MPNSTADSGPGTAEPQHVNPRLPLDLFDASITSNAFKMYVLLSVWTDDKAGHPLVVTHGLLSRCLKLSKRTVTTRVQELEQAGLITTESVFAGNDGRVGTRYTLQGGVQA